MKTDIKQFFPVGADRPLSWRVKGKVCRSAEVEKRSSYLEQPVAPTVESRDNGGVHVAAIQTLEGKTEKKETFKHRKESEGALLNMTAASLPFLTSFLPPTNSHVNPLTDGQAIVRRNKV